MFAFRSFFFSLILVIHSLSVASRFEIPRACLSDSQSLRFTSVGFSLVPVTGAPSLHFNPVLEDQVRVLFLHWLLRNFARTKEISGNSPSAKLVNCFSDFEVNR